MILDIDGIEFSYTSVPVLKDVKFTLQRGELLSILGNNGAGKSTLLKCINKILKPHKGAIYIEKDEISKLSRIEVAKRIGYVAQRNENGRFTVFDAVLLGRKPHIKWDVTERDIKIVNEVLKKFDLVNRNYSQSLYRQGGRFLPSEFSDMRNRPFRLNFHSTLTERKG